MATAEMCRRSKLPSIVALPNDVTPATVGVKLIGVHNSRRTARYHGVSGRSNVI